jgi:predicted DNA-binding protein with PD1-like motif
VGSAACRRHSGDREILSLAGTLLADGAHQHIAIADSSETVIGGHLCVGSLVPTTAELGIGLLPEWRFSRVMDSTIGFAELSIHLEIGSNSPED